MTAEAERGVPQRVLVTKRFQWRQFFRVNKLPLVGMALSSVLMAVAVQQGHHDRLHANKRDEHDAAMARVRAQRARLDDAALAALDEGTTGQKEKVRKRLHAALAAELGIAGK